MRFAGRDQRFLSRSARKLARELAEASGLETPFSRQSPFGTLRPHDRIFFFWFSQSDLFKDKPAGETLAGVSGATAGVGCVREDEPAEQGAEG